MSFSLVQVAMAQSAGAPMAQPSFLEQMFPLIIMFVGIYFFLFRPQIKKAKEKQNFIAAMKVGDEVVTSSGIIGRIKSINDSFVSLDVGPGNIRILREFIEGAPKQAAQK